MKNSTIVIALALIIAAITYRIIAVYNPELSNLSPIMALAFCSAVYFSRRLLWLVPFVALSASDLWIDHHYATEFGYTWELSSSLLRITFFALAIVVGIYVARRRTALNMISGVLGCSLLFFIATNTASWFGDAYYTKTLAGWWQAMTVGHVEFPPTLWFFRNSLIGDLLFTGIFALAMSRAEARLPAAVETAA